jgi:hypothetical protein
MGRAPRLGRSAWRDEECGNEGSSCIENDAYYDNGTDSVFADFCPGVVVLKKICFAEEAINDDKPDRKYGKVANKKI